VLREVLEDVLGQLLALGRQPVLDLGLVGEQDLLHPLQDHLVSLYVSVVAAMRPRESKVPTVRPVEVSTLSGTFNRSGVGAGDVVGGADDGVPGAGVEPLPGDGGAGGRGPDGPRSERVRRQ